MIQETILYNLDKKGNPIQWSITFDDEDNWYTMTSGRVNGALTTTEKTYCKGKNVGRSNETSDVSQCIFEVGARIEKQRKRGFQNDVPTEKMFNVTLAKEFNARKKFIKFPMLLSAKLDGFRCVITKDGMFSRTNHAILSCPHIFKALEQVFRENPNLVLDGELYSHALKQDFNKLASLLSRTKNIDEEFLKETESIIEFNIFDFFDKTNNTIPYSERAKAYGNVSYLGTVDFLKKLNNWKYCKFVIQHKVYSFEEVENWMEDSMLAGFEGIMLRDPNMIYEEGRSSSLIKYKRFKDAEYIVANIEDGNGNHTGQAATITCTTDSGLTFSAGLGKGWDEESRRHLFKCKKEYIGRKATIVFQELTPDGIPRFGKLLRFLTEL